MAGETGRAPAEADGRRSGAAESGGDRPSDLARAWLDVEARTQARVLLRLEDDELEDVFAEMADLPGRDMSLQLPLPRVLAPELESLRAAVAVEDLDEVVAALPPALSRVDSPLARQALARAVLACRDVGRVERVLAAAAVVELATAPTSRLMRNSLVEALAVSVGAAPTPSGLLVAAR